MWWPVSDNNFRRNLGDIYGIKFYPYTNRIMSTINLDKIALGKIATALRKASTIEILKATETLSSFSTVNVEYFRGYHLVKWFDTRENLSKLKLNDLSPSEINDIGNSLIEKGYFHTVRFDYDRNTLIAPTDNSAKIFDSDNLYVWDFKPQTFLSPSNFIVIILAIVFAYFFQYWPRWFIKFVFNTTLLFLIGSILLYILRFVIFVILYCFGFTVWVFPNLDSSDDLFDSFRPFITITKTKVSPFLRLALLGCIISLFSYLISNPQIYVSYTMDQRDSIYKFINGSFINDLLDNRDEYIKYMAEQNNKDGNNNDDMNGGFHYDDENDKSGDGDSGDSGSKYNGEDDDTNYRQNYGGYGGDGGDDGYDPYDDDYYDYDD